MPLYPLLPISLLIAGIHGSVALCLLLSGAITFTWRGQSVYAHVGAVLLALFVFVRPDAEPLSADGPYLFAIESRRDNGQSARLYGQIDGTEGVLTGRDLALGRPGETCLVTFTQTPFAPLRNTGGFDEAAWAYGAGLAFKGNDVAIEACRPSTGMSGRMLRWKERQLARIETTYRPDVALYMEALLFGDSRLLDEDTSFSYRVTGLLHLLVISGSHIALLVLGLRWSTRPLPLRRETKTLLILVAVTSFGWLTGFSPPVARAVLVADVLLVLSLFGYRVRDPIRLLSWCAAFLLALQPYLFWNLGFQLTVAMTLFLLVTRSIWTGPFGLAVYAQWFGLILLWPVQPVISVLAPVYNVVGAFLISWVVIPLALFAYIVPTAEPLLHPILDGLNGTFALHHDWRPWLPLHEFTFWHALGLAVVLWGGLMLLEWKRWSGWGLAVIALLLMHAVLEWAEAPRVTFLDVGQGDAVVVEYGEVTGVIDVGGVFQDPKESKRSTYDPGADVVAPYIWKRGETRLDFLLLTHADHDHVGGLSGLLSSIEVDEVWLSAEVADQGKRDELLAELAAYQVPVRLLSSGDRPYPWMWVVAPGEAGEDENANSVSLFMQVGALTYLLTGDLPDTREEMIPTVDVDVFKLGHHGSNTSSSEALLNRINPEWVIISVGRNNRYGHPHLDTLQRLEGKRVLRTDEDGMVVCERNRCRGIVTKAVPP
ncbi:MULTISPECIES: ComEC/Rec2 family competence protein [Exiguobacterium]|uniref:ComEC/Rec2 family competence protein n=1 Tax=Exiguobacterium TaxID=33986 RepID=UPI001BEC15FB|nr:MULTISPECIES: ComEC/Rec2 family competence protein [Exiguobacterium]MCT4776866.1 competence protein ComEC family protein [Exiguobacterium aquaticum]MCT4788233.1 competence protein ComEC family protein [Exiguobacterium mexicanum]